MNLLSNAQKAGIAMLARRAYAAWPGRAAFEQANHERSPSKCFEAWRRVEQGKAVGLPSLRLCLQDHFLPLRAHFGSLAGADGRALNDLMRHAEEPRIRARWKLQQALDERGLDENYAAAICRAQFKCALGDASEKQLWNLFFTVSKRRKKVAQFSAQPRRRFVKVKSGTLSIAGSHPSHQSHPSHPADPF